MSVGRILRKWPAVVAIVVIVAFGTLALARALGTTATVCSGVDLADCTETTYDNGAVLVAGGALILGVAIASRLAQRQKKAMS